MPRKVLTFLSAVAFLAAAPAFGQATTLFFHQFTPQGGSFELDGSTRIILKNDSAELRNVLQGPRGWLSKLRYATGLNLQITTGVSAGAKDIVLDNMPGSAFMRAVEVATVTVDVDSRIKAIDGKTTTRHAASVRVVAKKDIGHNVGNEGYAYRAGTGGVTIEFMHTAGALRGIQSLTEMLIRDGRPAGQHRRLPAGTGVDYPKFEKRIVMFDVARTFMPVEMLLGAMEQMSLHKLNVLHMHLTDDARLKGKRVSNGFMRLAHERASFTPVDNPNNFYSREDWDLLEDTAARLGIEIVPEIDSPGHSLIWTVDAPTLVSRPHPNDWIHNARILDTNDKTNRENAANYIADFIKSYRDWFRSGKVHVGVDEAKGNTWNNDVLYLNYLADQLRYHATDNPKGYKEVQFWQNSNFHSWQVYKKPITNVAADLIPTHWTGFDLSSHSATDGSHKRWYMIQGSWYVVPFGWNGNGLSPQRILDLYEDEFLEPYAVFNAIPDGIGTANWNDQTLLKGSDHRKVNSSMRHTIAGMGYLSWSGGTDQTGTGGRTTVRIFANTGYSGTQYSSWELASYAIADRFPYLSGVQAFEILTLVFNARSINRWMLWDTRFMDRALTGPARFASGMYVADLAGQGAMMASGRVCHDYFAAQRPDQVSACDADSWTNAISGAGGLRKRGAGKLSLQGSNTFSGGVRIEGGVLEVAADRNLGRGGITFAGGTLSFAGQFDLGPARPITVAGKGTFSTGTHVIGIGGTIRGSGYMDLLGTGEVSFGGQSPAFGGTISVGAGSPEVYVDGLLGHASRVHVTDGGLLGGDGSLGDVVVEAGGTLMPGSGRMVIAGGLTLKAGSTYEISLGMTNSLGIAVQGDAQIGGTVTVRSDLGQAMLVSRYNILGVTGSRSGRFQGLRESFPFANAVLNYDNPQAVSIVFDFDGGSTIVEPVDPPVEPVDPPVEPVDPPVEPVDPPTDTVGPGQAVLVTVADGEQVAPLFKSFTPVAGNMNLELGGGSRIVMLQGDDDLKDLLEAPGGWLSKLRYATGLALQLTVTSSPDADDIVLSTSPDSSFMDLADSSAGKGVTITSGTYRKNIGDNVEREGYQYQVGTGGVSVKFASAQGALRAVQSLTELLMLDNRGAGAHRLLPAGAGVDYPDLERRILWLDGASAFIPVEQLEGFMEGMSRHRLNVLHLRLNGDASDGSTVRGWFRLASSDSDLQPHDGASKAYTRADWDRLEAAAKRYGITIVPEIHSGGRSLVWQGDDSSLPKLSKNNSRHFNAGYFDLRSSTKRGKVVSYMTVLINTYRDWFQSGIIHIGLDEAGPANKSPGNNPANMVAYANSMYDALIYNAGTNTDGFREVQVFVAANNFPANRYFIETADGLRTGMVPVIFAGNHYDTRVANTRMDAWIAKCQGFSPFDWQSQGLAPSKYYTEYKKCLTAFAADNVMPDGVALEVGNQEIKKKGLTADAANASLKRTIPGVGLAMWHGTPETGYAAVGYDNRIGVSQELLSYHVRERFPYFAGEQALALLLGTARHRVISGSSLANGSPTWMLWDAEDMAKALAGPVMFSSGMQVADLPGEGGAMENGRVCTDLLAATRTDGVSACSRDEWPNAISGSGGLQKSGRGRLVLSGVNTFSGGILLSGGELQVAADNNLGTATVGIAFDGGTLRFGGAFDVASRPLTLRGKGGGIDTNGHDIEVSQTITGAGGIRKAGLGKLSLSGMNTYSGDTFVLAGALEGNAGSIRGALGMGGSATVIFNAPTSATFAGAVSGSGIFEKMGAGTLTLSESAQASRWKINGGGIEGRKDFRGDIEFMAAANTFVLMGSGQTGVMAGAGSLDKRGEGMLRISGDSSSFSGDVNVAGNSTLYVAGMLGSTSDVNVASGALLQGAGRLGNVVVRSGGTILPGDQSGSGRMTIAGDLTLEADSRYELSISMDDDMGIEVQGDASIAGVLTVRTMLKIEEVAYTILTVDGSLSGRFAALEEELPFVDASLTYANPKAVGLEFGFGRLGPDVFSDFVGDEKQREFSRALTDFLTENEDGGGNSLAIAMMLLPNDPEVVRKALDTLPGEVHASVKPVVVETNAAVQGAAASQIRAAFSLPGAEVSQVDASNMRFSFAQGANSPAIWTKGAVFWGENAGTLEKEGIKYDGTGLLVGGDLGFAENNLRLGLFGGRNELSFEQSGEGGTTGEDDSHSLGVYGGGQWQSFSLRGGAYYTKHEVSSKRTVAMPGDPEFAAGYDAETYTAFGEVGYVYAVGDSFFEPFLGVSYSSHNTDAFTERASGGLSMDSKERKMEIGAAELGVHASAKLDLGKSRGRVRGLISWKILFDSPEVDIEHALSSSNTFKIRGAPVSDDKIAIELGLDLEIDSRTGFSLSYIDSELSGTADNENRAVEAQLHITF